MSQSDSQTNIRTEWIEITAEDGKTFKAYQALPHKGKGPGILLIQEIFGVNGHMRGVAEQYAMDGYSVIVPDMFWRDEPGVELGYDGDDWKAAVAHKKALDYPTAVSDLRAATKALRASPVCDGPIASVGYCMGGVFSYLCALDAGVDAAICYYAGGVTEYLPRANTSAPRMTTSRSSRSNRPARPLPATRMSKCISTVERNTASTAGHGRATTSMLPRWRTAVR